MKKLLMVLVLGASAVAASAQGLQPRRTLGSRLARPRPQATEGIVGKEAIKVIPTAREGGATWKYKESDKPLANWADLSFDDKDWQEGTSGFGNSYGLRRTAWTGGIKNERWTGKGHFAKSGRGRRFTTGRNYLAQEKSISENISSCLYKGCANVDGGMFRGFLEHFI